METLRRAYASRQSCGDVEHFLPVLFRYAIRSLRISTSEDPKLCAGHQYVALDRRFLGALRWMLLE